MIESYIITGWYEDEPFEFHLFHDEAVARALLDALRAAPAFSDATLEVRRREVCT